MSALQDVLRLLPTLSPKDLSEVRLRVDFLNGAGPKPEEDWLLAGLREELKRRGLVAGSFAALPDSYRKKAPDVRSFLLKGYSKTSAPAYVQRLALAQFGGAALAEYLPRLSIPLGPKTLLVNVDKIPEALEASFPGYWAARAFWCCLEAR